MNIVIFAVIAVAFWQGCHGLSDDQVRNTVLDKHNELRALHQDTPSVTWNTAIAQAAKTYAQSLDSGPWKHSGTQYGENLASFWPGPCSEQGIADAVQRWYNEITDYSWASPGYSDATGHFTQVVWKATTEIGCGVNAGTDWCYLDCQYNPAGNMNVAGYFEENVKPVN